jgi:arsenate reductase (thioredoxin)
MQAKPYNVLFLCRHNAARSIMAEAILNSLATDKKRFQAYSAGSQPVGEINPFALEQIRAAGLATEGLRSKHWGEFAAPGAPRMHFVITVCDDITGETCPVWPGSPMSTHWGVRDPERGDEPDLARRRMFSSTYIFLHNRIGVFASLPIEKLGLAVIRNKLDALDSGTVGRPPPEA